MPTWPLSEPSPRELVIWERQWRRPQAIVWEERGQFEEVAMYARRFAEAERPGSSVASGTLVRQMMESLGISGPGLRVNRWIIVGEGEPVTAVERTQVRTARERLKAV